MFEYFREHERFGFHENSSFNFDKLADPKRGTIYHETSLNVSRESRGHNACHSCAIRSGKICFHGLFERGCISFFFANKTRSRAGDVVGEFEPTLSNLISPFRFFCPRKETKTRFRQEKRSRARNDRNVVFFFSFFFFTIVEQRRSTNWNRYRNQGELKMKLPPFHDEISRSRCSITERSIISRRLFEGNWKWNLRALGRKGNFGEDEEERTKLLYRTRTIVSRWSEIWI